MVEENITEISQLDPDTKDIETMIREASQNVEQELALEDQGWIKLGNISGDVTTDQERIASVKRARTYYTKDPLARQAIRLWTDYTFGSGMTWQSEEEATTEALDKFWSNKANRSILSAQGQRTSSDKLLVDGEILFALFLGAEGEAKIRRIDPLEITEIITNPDDIEDVRYYKRTWMNRQSQSKITYYRSITNKEDEHTLDMSGKPVSKTDDALVFHMAINTLGQRGYSLLLPASDWIRQYRRFLASRIAVMLALARFAWKTKITGGQTQVDAIKAVTQSKSPAAGSTLIENLLSETQQLKTDSGASQAYQDGRMIKMQVCAAFGIPEVYFGDIGIGNWATARSVELPLQKMFESYQQIWRDAYKTITEVALEHNGVKVEDAQLDFDFPEIAPHDSQALLTAIATLSTAMPELVASRDIRQLIFSNLGIADVNAAIDRMEKESAGDGHNATGRLVKALREYKVEASGGV